MANELFGVSIKSILQQDPPAIANEEELLHAVIQKTGPWADQQKLLWHIRASRGKVHWAVNSYFRAILTAPRPASAREDFDSKPCSSWQLISCEPSGSVADGSDMAPPAAAMSPAALSSSQAWKQRPSSIIFDEHLATSNKLPLSRSLQELCAAAAAKVVAATTAAAAAAVAVGSRPSAASQHVPPPPALPLEPGALAATDAHQLDVQQGGVPQEDLSPMVAAACQSAMDLEHCQDPSSISSSCMHVGAPTTTSSLTSSGASLADTAPVRLDGLPGNALEVVMSQLDLQSLVCAACSCKALHRAVQADQLWRHLFNQRWGSVIFPTSTYDSSSSSSIVRPPRTGSHPCRDRASSIDVQQQQQQVSDTVSAAVAVAAAAAASAVQQAAPAHAVAHEDINARYAAASAATHAGAGAAAYAYGGGHGRAGTMQASAGCADVNSRSNKCTSSCKGSSNGSNGSPAAAGGSLPVAARTVAGVTAGTSGPVCARSLCCSCCCCGTCRILPDVAPSGSWQRQYRQQYSYQLTRTCPKCGSDRVLPIVYGFPSHVLLQGMQAHRLVLGGDHLLDSAHVWACSGCRSCFRYFPYGNVQLWVQDDAAAAKSGPTAGQLGFDAQPGMEGFPRYTYEL